MDLSGNPLIAGQTHGAIGGSDGLLAKYTTGGQLAWRREIGTTESDTCRDVGGDAMGNVYVGGQTQGTLTVGHPGLQDAFVAKYSSDGTPQWVREVGWSGSDGCRGLTVDANGNSYLLGSTTGSLGAENLGGTDVFVAKHDAFGTLVWIAQFGSAGGDSGRGIALDGVGNCYITGFTDGDMGAPNAGEDDLFVAKLNADGALDWTWQMGTPQYDEAWGIAAASDGTVFITGKTYGDLLRTNNNDYEAFVIALVPEPTSLVLLALGAAIVRRRRKI